MKKPKIIEAKSLQEFMHFMQLAKEEKWEELEKLAEHDEQMNEGKSDFMKELAEHLGLELVDLSLAPVDVMDFTGLIEDVKHPVCDEVIDEY